MSKQADDKEPNRNGIGKRMVTGILGLALFISAWFTVAGRVTWWQGWAFILTFIIYVSILVWRLSKVDPELMQERNRPAQDAEAWDRILMGVYSVTLILLLVVSALDGGRYLWSLVPLVVQLIGWVLLIIAGTIVWHVMMINAYLSSWARIQDDRGQVVVQKGMYRHIRHPMYLGIILGILGIPLVLNSWWALFPSVVIGVMFVYRTYKEDQMLMGGLDGYTEYMEKVKYRLLPGIW